MLASVFCVAAPGGSLRAGNAQEPSTESSTLAASSSGDWAPEETRRRVQESRRDADKKRKEVRKRRAERMESRQHGHSRGWHPEPSKAELGKREGELKDLRERTGLDKLQLVHIPKTGGTTLEEVGKKFGIAWGGVRQDWPEGNCALGCPDTWHPCSPWHVPPAAFLDHGPNPYASKDTFCIVRHPFTRAISEYVFMDTVCSADGLNKAVQSMFKAINASVGKIEDSYPHMKSHALKVVSRTQFAGVCAAVDWRFHNGECWRPQTTSDCHWIPQHLYAQDCDHVLHVESLRDEFKAMMSNYGDAISGDDLEDFRCTQAMPCERADKCKLTVSDLDETSKAMLHEMYAEDFRRLGYEAEVLPSRDRSRLRARQQGAQEEPQEDSPATSPLQLFDDDEVGAYGAYEDAANYGR